MGLQLGEREKIKVFMCEATENLGHLRVISDHLKPHSDHLFSNRSQSSLSYNYATFSQTQKNLLLSRVVVLNLRAADRKKNTVSSVF